MALAFDCSRSSLLDYEFPHPIYYVGQTTGSTTSTWGQRWTSLRYWPPDDVATAFLYYWDSRASVNDKDELIALRTVVDWHVMAMRSQQRPARDELQVRAVFDAGISWAHRIAISADNGQRPPSDPHSTIQMYRNVVFGQPDYVLQSPASLQVTGICEAKSPWNIGPSEIDDVITGSTD